MQDTMKYSGVEWIGDIPERWTCDRIGYLLVDRKENNNPIKTSNILSLTAKQGVVPIAEKEGAGGNKPKEDLSQYRLAYPGDIVMNNMNVVSGSVGLSRYFGCVSPVYYMLRPRQHNEDVRYYNYLFQVDIFQRGLICYGNGIMVKESDNGKLNTVRMRISMSSLNHLKFPHPMPIEQKAIADYLDDKCSDIDAVIEIAKKEIETYEEYKRAIIAKAVTKGLDNSVKMKESGIGLIGFIPENWNTSRMKYLFSFGKGLSITKADLVDEGVPVVSYGQIHAKNNTGTSLDDSLIRYVPVELSRNSNAILHKGDFAFAYTSEDFEGIGNCVYVDDERNIYAGYHVVTAKSKSNNDNRYLAYLFKTDEWRYQLRTSVSGVKVYSLTQSILCDASVLIPPISEQKKIADFLDVECSKVNHLIKLKLKTIDKLTEYKKSLIYAYVTGKKEVPHG